MKPWLDDRITANGRSVCDNFFDWFEDSRVRDCADLPLVVYHGTRHDFEAFRVAGTFGAHFSSTPAAANDFTECDGGNVIPAFLSLQNPVRIKDLGAWDAYEMLDELVAAGALTVDEAMPLRLATDEGEFEDDLLIAALQKRGHDGLVYLNRGEGIAAETGGGFEMGWSDARFLKSFPSAKDAYVVFQPEQVKSAIGNSGLYLKNSPSLTDAHGGVDLRLMRDAQRAMAIIPGSALHVELVG